MTTVLRTHTDTPACWCHPTIVLAPIDNGSQGYGIRHNYVNHTCKCEHCSPSSYPNRDDATWDVERDRNATAWPKTILLNGQTMQSVVSVKAALAGWVIALSHPEELPLSPAHACQQCFRGACMEYRMGNVRIVGWRTVDRR